jgi:peptidoglycan/LPS O-acetylase OafA/YrhL
MIFVVFVAVVLLSRTNIAVGKNFRSFCFALGGITYPLYLLHSKISEVVIKHYGFIFGEVNFFSVMLVVSIVAFSYVISVYEFKIRKFLKEKYFTF